MQNVVLQLVSYVLRVPLNVFWVPLFSARGVAGGRRWPWPRWRRSAGGRPPCPEESPWTHAVQGRCGKPTDKRPRATHPFGYRTLQRIHMTASMCTSLRLNRQTFIYQRLSQHCLCQEEKLRRYICLARTLMSNWQRQSTQMPISMKPKLKIDRIYT